MLLIYTISLEGQTKKLITVAFWKAKLVAKNSKGRHFLLYTLLYLVEWILYLNSNVWRFYHTIDKKFCNTN